MKILDIIKEESDLGEAVPPGAKETVSKFAQWAMGSGKKDVTKKIAAVWKDDILKGFEQGVKPKLTNVSHLVPQNLKADPKLMRQAFDQAKKQAKKEVWGRGINRVKTGIQTGVSTTGRAIKSTVKWGSRAAYAAAVGWGVYRPIELAYSNIETATEDFEGSKEMFKTKESLDAYTQQQVSQAVTQVAAILTANAVLRKAGSLTLLGKAFPNLGNLVQAGTAAYIINSDFDKAAAKWLVGQTKFPGGPEFQRLVGSLYNEGLRYLTGKEQEAAKASGGSSSQTTAQGQQRSSTSEPNGTAGTRTSASTASGGSQATAPTGPITLDPRTITGSD